MKTYNTPEIMTVTVAKDDVMTVSPAFADEVRWGAYDENGLIEE